MLAAAPERGTTVHSRRRLKVSCESTATSTHSARVQEKFYWSPDGYRFKVKHALLDYVAGGPASGATYNRQLYEQLSSAAPEASMLARCMCRIMNA